MKKWKCTVCGYIHKGDEPPETCPVCGADRSKFVQVVDEPVSQESKSTAPPTQSVVPAAQPEPKHSFFIRQMLRHHLHPISVHIPNGLLPVSVLFLFISALFDIKSLGTAGYYNIACVLLAMPIVLFSGYIEWKKRYGGKLTLIFTLKIICALVVAISSFIIVLWRFSNPDILLPASDMRWPFLFLNFIMLSAAGLAGFLGGKLVFKD